MQPALPRIRSPLRAWLHSPFSRGRVERVSQRVSGGDRRVEASRSRSRQKPENPQAAAATAVSGSNANCYQGKPNKIEHQFVWLNVLPTRWEEEERRSDRIIERVKSLLLVDATVNCNFHDGNCWKVNNVPRYETHEGAENCSSHD